MNRLSVSSNDQARKKSEFLASAATSIIEEDIDIEYSSDEDGPQGRMTQSLFSSLSFKDA